MMGGKSGRSIAAQGAANLRGLKKGQSGRPVGNMAGFNGGRSTYIQSNESGYGNVKRAAQPDMSMDRQDMRGFKPYKGAENHVRVDNNRFFSHWTKRDRELAKKIT